MDLSKVIVIIPCYNSQNRIASVIDKTLKFVDSIVVIDDGSTDSSAKIACQKGAQVISLDNNQGVGIATQIGMKVALSMDKTTIITLDADGAHNPQNIEKLLDCHLSQKNIITIGNRWNKYNTTLPSQKWWANKFASVLVNSVIETNITDVACGFRVFDKSLAEVLLKKDLVNGFGFIYQSVFEASHVGKMGSVPIEVRYDANDILATKQKELLELLGINKMYCVDKGIIKSIEEIEKKASNFQKIQVLLKINKYKNEHIVLQPLKEYAMYLFQWQHPEFCSAERDFIAI